MSTLLVAILSFLGYLIAYHTYGRFLAKKIFNLDPAEPVPSRELQDNIDFVPTNRHVLFGHHFTSIAGTGPIVGPAIAVMWGWLPALLWVIFGCIFVGAVHDFAALVLSVRNQGHTLGDLAGEVVSPAAKRIFLLILAFVLVILIAVFANVIAVIFDLYPQAVIPVWTSLPLAIILGLVTRKLHVKLLIPSLCSLFLLYYLIYAGTTWIPPLQITAIHGTPFWESYGTPVVIWSAILMVYCFFAAILPVWLLLQPRDYINSLQLYVAMAMMVLGLCVAAFTCSNDLFATAPALRIAEASAQGAPPIWPFLFITVACGAVSGFHALVSSGTSSKQMGSMADAQYIGYGSMLVEGVLAVLVILACTAGLGMFLADDAVGGMSGAWLAHYGKNWADLKLGEQVGIFVQGGGNFIASMGISFGLARGIVAVLVVSFAATTIDTAMRLFRYVLQELGGAIHIAPLRNKYVATTVGVLAAFLMALVPGPSGQPGTGGMILWPLFGAANQLIAGLTLIVGTVYLYQRKRMWGFLGIPMVTMLIIPLYALGLNMYDWCQNSKYLLIAFDAMLVVLAFWLMREGVCATNRLVAKFPKNSIKDANQQQNQIQIQNQL